MQTASGPSRWYISTRKGHAYSEQVVEDFERGLSRHGVDPLGSAKPASLWDIAGRLAGKVRITRSARRSEAFAVVGLMGLAERQIYPYIFRHNLAPYIWDCWPSREADWRSFFARYQFRRIGFTCADAARFWSKELGDTKVHWIPEAIDNYEYPPGPILRDRPAILLEIGRMYEKAHLAARSALADMPASHTFRENEDAAYLPYRSDLVRALHHHRSILCYPGSISHPAGRTGSWEAMTHRYLEALSTKTLVIGHIPKEMTRLFGFEPGITISPDRLPELIRSISMRPEAFQELVDRSYARLLEVATWEVRSRDIERLLLS